MTVVRLAWRSDRVPAVDLPCWRLVDLDPGSGTALVDVPDVDLPPGDRHRRELLRDALRPGGRRAWPRQDVLDAWYRHLDDRYQEHAGRFRPVPV